MQPDIARIQLRAAVLCSLQSSFLASHDRHTLLAEVDGLQSTVRDHSTALADRLSALPAEITTHSRILDTVRALDSVGRVLERARNGLLADDSGAPLPASALPVRGSRAGPAGAWVVSADKAARLQLKSRTVSEAS